ncbi:MAG: hypothetical protein ACXVZH_09280 [Terriglobales bacterium]
MRHDFRQRSAHLRYGRPHSNEEVEHEAWFIELLAHERDGKIVPSGHFRRGDPGHAPYSKNAGFYNP